MRFIGNAPVDGEVRAIASGALATGEAVVVNSDGTVSVVGFADQSSGSEVTFEAAATIAISSAYDSNSNKVVVAYRDNGNSDQGTAIVGTVSGTSISFGSPASFSSGAIESTTRTVFDSSNNKIVVVYGDTLNSNYGTAVVGTVSGTSISFGTPVVFESANAQGLSATFDTTNSKVVVTYRDDGNSGYGTAIVGTVSGTSISFGSPVIFNNAGVYDTAPTFDSSNDKVVIAYRDAGNSFYGTAIVGTVSGTSISFGSSSVFRNANAQGPAASFDTASGKIVIAYRDSGNSYYGTAIVGTVSGTSISFGSAVVYESASSNHQEVAFDPASGKTVVAYGMQSAIYGKVKAGIVSGTSINFGDVLIYNTGETNDVALTVQGSSGDTVISFRDIGASQHGKSVVYQAGPTTLTAENFIGFANSGYASGQSAALNSTCSVDKNQSGLTAGQTYYVQADGTLGTTPADPSVVAGTAISSNSIIVKG